MNLTRAVLSNVSFFFFCVIISAVLEPRVTIVQVSSWAITAPSLSRRDHREPRCDLDSLALVRPARSLSIAKTRRGKAHVTRERRAACRLFSLNCVRVEHLPSQVVIEDLTQARRNEQPSSPPSQRLLVSLKG